MEWQFEAELWPWRERLDSWVFVAVPTDISDEIGDHAVPGKGFGSARVEVSIGITTWQTSVFPGSDGYVLPLKKQVRHKEGLQVGDTATIDLRLI